jgi:hypothetical protein
MQGSANTDSVLVNPGQVVSRVCQREHFKIGRAGHTISRSAALRWEMDSPVRAEVVELACIRETICPRWRTAPGELPPDRPIASFILQVNSGENVAGRGALTILSTAEMRAIKRRECVPLGILGRGDSFGSGQRTNTERGVRSVASRNFQSRSMTPC